MEKLIDNLSSVKNYAGSIRKRDFYNLNLRFASNMLKYQNILASSYVLQDWIAKGFQLYQCKEFENFLLDKTIPLEDKGKIYEIAAMHFQIHEPKLKGLSPGPQDHLNAVLSRLIANFFNEEKSDPEILNTIVRFCNVASKQDAEEVTAAILKDEFLVVRAVDALKLLDDTMVTPNSHYKYYIKDKLPQDKVYETLSRTDHILIKF